MTRRNKKKSSSCKNEECKHAVIFSRVSSERQEAGASIDAQTESVYNYCNKKDFTIIKEFTITESSTIKDRKQYKEMLSFVKSKKQKIAIVVNCVDRLQRSYKDTPILDELRKEGRIEVHFIKENLILHKESSGMDIMFWNMSVLMANSYVLSLSDNVKRSMNHNKSLGIWQGPAPTGYINILSDDNKKSVMQDEDSAPIVKKLFTEYATGLHTLQSITNLAKELGLTTSRAKNRKTVKTISRTSVHYMLANPFYYGFIEYKDNLVQHKYEPIVSKSLFDKVQDCLDGKFNVHAKNTYGTLPFVFRGIIRCSTCGCAISQEKHTNKSGKQYTYLRCSHLKGDCNQGIVNEDVIFKQLNNEIFSNSMKLSKKMIDLIKKNVKKILDEEANINASATKNLTDKRNILLDKQEEIGFLLFKKKINETEYDSRNAKLKAEIAELEEASTSFVNIGDNIKKSIENIIEIAANLANLMNNSDVYQQRKLFALIFEECLLENKKVVYKLKKPFDKLLTQPNNQEFLNLETDNLDDFNELSINISQFNANRQVA